MSSNLLNLTRRFRVVSDANLSDDSLRSWEELSKEAAVVILGSPGAGKTTTLLQAANSDSNGLYVTVRAFSRQPLVNFQDKALYLDALDEARPDSTDKDKIDQLVFRLNALGKPTFRLSCREADWLGRSDVTALRDAVTPGQKLNVVRLEPLDDEQVVELAGIFGAEDPRAFARQAKEHQLDELLRNPETLKLLVKSIAVAKRPWPKTRTSLLTTATNVLVRETNEEHQDDHEAQFTISDLLNAAGQICAVMLLGGVEALSKKIEAGEFSIFEVGLDRDLALAATKRRIFEEPAGKIVPVHRMVAEYLASQFLAKQYLEGALPISRVVALMTGPDGSPATDMRGLFAAFTTMERRIAEQLLERDPIGVVIYGDVAGLSVDLKRRILDALVALSRRDPYFRVGAFDDQFRTFSARQFGSLSTPELFPIFRSLLDTERDSNHLIATICEIIEWGADAHDLQDKLVEVVRDETRPEWQRSSALSALVRACPNSENLLVQLLDGIADGRIREEGRQLRGQLLNHLYPQHVHAGELPRYLIPDVESSFTTYSRFLRYTVSERTKPRDVPCLLDYLSQSTDVADDYVDRGFERLHQRLLLAILESDLPITGGELFRWTTPFADGGRRTMSDDTIMARIIAELQRRENVVIDLYRYGVTEHPELFSGMRMHFEFRRRLLGLPAPRQVIQILLDAAIRHQDAKVAQDLFVSACLLAREQEGLDVRKFRGAVSRRPELQAAWRQWKAPKRVNIDPETRALERRHRQADRRRKKKRERARSENARKLGEVKSDIEAGNNLGALSFLAQVYYGNFVDLEGETPEERLKNEVGDELRESAIRGFQALLLRAPVPALDDVVSAYVESRHYNIGFAVLAGLDILSSSRPTELLQVPEEVLQAAFAFHFTNLTMERRDNTERNAERHWLERIAVSRPEIAASVMTKLLVAQLLHGKEHLTGLYEVTRNEAFRRFASDICTKLLEDYPEMRTQHLREVLICLISLDRERAKTIVSRVVERWGTGDASKLAYWIAAGFSTDLDGYDARLRDVVRGNPDWAWDLAEFVTDIHKNVRLDDIGIRKVEIFISIFAPLFPPAGMPTGTSWGSGHPWQRAHLIEGLIDALSSNVHLASTEALSRLADDPTLAHWSKSIKHALAVQLRRRSEASFTRPTPENVVETLRNGPPASASDLVATALECLTELQTAVRNGKLDGWKRFWNVEGRHSNPTSARPEEECRDTLVTLLEPLLKATGISVETEARAPNGKKIDIKLVANDIAVPVEVKRQDNRELWTAPSKQLVDFYVREPASGGSGIYLVVWFGATVRVQAETKGAQLPSTAEELNTLLEKSIAEAGLDGIEVFVLDVSDPN